jgi:SNF2 family DNA or RNA helicase
MKTSAMPHQAQELAEHGADAVRAVFFEQGLGKTWIALAEAEAFYRAGVVDAMLVLAPNGIHSNWVQYEIEPHLEVPHLAFAFDSHKAKTKAAQQMAEAVLQYRQGLAILTMSYDGIKTAIGKALAKAFLTKRKVFYVADESNRIKSPAAIVTRTVLASAKYAAHKRILCGTPITNSPFDLYAQVKFLDWDFWARTQYGISTFGAFKSFYGVWDTGYNGQQRREFKILKSYRNLDILKKLLEPLASRLLKEDMLTLPPKVYSYQGFDMTPKQRALYDELESEFMVMLGQEMVMAPLAITRLLRLQQITCGYLPVEGQFVPVDDHNPRLDLFKEICADLPHKTIIWARFRADIDQIVKALPNCVRWDGSIPLDEREANKRKFLEDPVCQFMAATPESMGEGHTLTVAETEIYYSNSYKLKERLQSEDRCHRIGTTKSVHIIDIVANDTLDIRIVEALRKKFDMASGLIDNRFRSWLRDPKNNLELSLTPPPASATICE